MGQVWVTKGSARGQYDRVIWQDLRQIDRIDKAWAKIAAQPTCALDGTTHNMPEWRRVGDIVRADPFSPENCGFP